MPRGRGSRRGQPVEIGGTRLRSKFEGDVWSDALRRGLSLEYESVRLVYSTPHVYRPDFRLPNGILVEAKGYFPTVERTKLLAVREAHPEIDLRLLFQTPDTKLRRGAKTTYGQWATQHNFKWAGGASIPQAWIDER